MSLVRLLIYILVLTAPLGIFSRFELGDNISLYLNDILIGVIVSFWAYYSVLLKKKISIPTILYPLGFFAFIAGISLLLSNLTLDTNEVIISSLYLFRFIEYITLCLVVANTFDEKSLENLKNTMIISGLFLALLGFIQYLVIPDFSSLAASGGWDPHQYRLLSTFFDPNFLGLYLSFAATILMVEWLAKNEIVTKRYAYLHIPLQITKEWVKLLILLIIVFAVILTYSRSSYLAFGVSFMTLALMRWRWLLVIIPVAILVVVGFFPRVLDRFNEGVGFGTSGEARLIEWENALRITQDHPLLGIGFNTYRYVQQDYGFKAQEGAGHSGAGTDSSLLLILATTGVVGVSIFILFLFGIFYLALDLIRKRDLYGYILLASLFSLLIHSQFVNSFFYPWILEWVFLLIGICVVKNYAHTTVSKN